MQEVTQEMMQKRFAEVAINYTKRNGSYIYNQSLSAILTRIFEVVFYAEHTFWLYVMLLEHILPPNFYSQTLYPQSFLDFTRELMQLVDKRYMQMTEDAMQMFCLKSYYTLFTNLESKTATGGSSNEIAYFFLDMLFLLGNSKRSMTICDMDIGPPCLTGCMYELNDKVLQKVYLDRTSQILVCAAVAIADLIKMWTKRKSFTDNVKRLELLSDYENLVSMEVKDKSHLLGKILQIEIFLFAKNREEMFPTKFQQLTFQPKNKKDDQS